MSKEASAYWMRRYIGLLQDMVIMFGKDANLSDKDAELLDNIGWDGWRRAQGNTGFGGLKIDLETAKQLGVVTMNWNGGGEQGNG